MLFRSVSTNCGYLTDTSFQEPKFYIKAAEMLVRKLSLDYETHNTAISLAVAAGNVEFVRILLPQVVNFGGTITDESGKQVCRVHRIDQHESCSYILDFSSWICN